MKVKCGIGFDAHKFAPNRRLMLGGVEIPGEEGLDGHSDADVLIHAVIDSLSGPALHKDIGCLFPDTDAAYKGIDSKILLMKVCSFVRDAGYEISNTDAEIIAQKPKLSPYIPEMRRVMAQTMGISEDDVSIKATTTEKMGFTGRKEGIAVIATSLIVRKS